MPQNAKNPSVPVALLNAPARNASRPMQSVVLQEGYSPSRPPTPGLFHLSVYTLYLCIPIKVYLDVFHRLLGEQLLDLLLGPQELERRLDDAVEQEGEVDEQGEAEDLQPLERLPAEAERDDPDEERPAGVDGRAGGGADGPRDGEAKEVEAAVWFMFWLAYLLLLF